MSMSRACPGERVSFSSCKCYLSVTEEKKESPLKQGSKLKTQLNMIITTNLANFSSGR